jgi:hypothetical protein
MRKARLTSLRTLSCSVLGLGGALAVTASAAASAPNVPGRTGASKTNDAMTRSLPPSLAIFSHCPVKNPAVTLCLFSRTTSTTFTIGSTTVTSSQPATVSLGLYFQPSGAASVVLPDDGSKALASPPIPLPGGLLGIPGSGVGPLAVDVTPQLVGIPQVNIFNIFTGKGPTLVMPIDVLVSTPTGLLGPDCTIASPGAPAVLKLTTGTTAPPPPNKPITGSHGTLSSKSNGETIVSGLRLVDNAFAVPGAANCGLGGLLDPVLDLDKGLPSAAGKNTATLAGNSYTIPASVIRHYLG